MEAYSLIFSHKSHQASVLFRQMPNGNIDKHLSQTKRTRICSSTKCNELLFEFGWHCGAFMILCLFTLCVVCVCVWHCLFGSILKLSVFFYVFGRSFWWSTICHKCSLRTESMYVLWTIFLFSHSHLKHWYEWSSEMKKFRKKFHLSHISFGNWARHLFDSELSCSFHSAPLSARYVPIPLMN